MHLQARNILIVEDETEIADLLALHLGDLGAKVTIARDGDQGLQRIRQQIWDIVILDIQLPGVNGLELCRTLRSLECYTSIIMLTSRGTELDRVLGLEQGADDYITKPFSIMEVIARVKAQCRRIEATRNQVESQTPSTSTLNLGSLCIDPTGRTVTLDNRIIELTGKEFDLLVHFAQSPNRVFKRIELLDSIWGYSHEGYEHTVNTHINRLRAKIEPDPTNPSLIVTVWGVGYKLQHTI